MRVLGGDPDREEVGRRVVGGQRRARLERGGNQARRADALPDDARRPGEGSLDVAFGVADFKSYAVAPDGGSGDYPFALRRQMTPDRSKVVEALSGLPA